MSHLPSAPSRRHSARHAFTLIELLVVIAIIAILAAILFPVFAKAREKARQTACLSNGKQIGTALMMYNQDFDEMMPGSIPNVPPVNGGSNNGYGTYWDREPYDGYLRPYIKSDGALTCPDANGAMSTSGEPPIWDGNYLKSPKPRSWAYVAEIYTNYPNLSTTRSSGLDGNTGMSTSYDTSSSPATGHTLAQIDQPSSTIALSENWTSGASYMGSPWGSTFTDCDATSIPGRTPGVTSQTDPNSLPSSCNANNVPSQGHTGFYNMIYADGHCKNTNYQQARANDFYLFKLSKPTTVVTP